MTTTRSYIRHGALALAAASSCLAVQSAAIPASAATTHAARACAVPKYPGSGYFTSLHVTHTSCGTGRKVARAHYHCRRKHGVRGHCHHAVLHFHCKEHRPASGQISTQYNARVTCKRGSRRVVFTYQQNT
ncbi:MAG: hypothetical protein QOF65_549 [Thermoleophilaceae bacterium]|jgi:hypothetical protein|nr:hypothetical protein [Thermoleophilaceae bacterium]MEA2435993.1 hypothetical protein [Thermoleophilaceae bacterium]